MRKAIAALIAVAELLALLSPAGFRGWSFVIPIPSPVPSSVPTAYRATYAFLRDTMSRANKVLDSVDKGQSNPVIFGAELLAANGNRGTVLLAPNAIEGVRAYLDGLKGLNVQGVTVAVSYPLILSRFPKHDQYLAFFKQAAQEVRSRGMKLDVETGPIFPQQGITVSYAGLTLSRYSAEKNEMARTILDELQPDYLNIGAEPDTEAALLSLPQLNAPRTFAAHVTRVLQGLDRGGTKVAAGIGTWGNIGIARSLAGTSLDAIVIHFYPINQQYMTTALEVAALAHQSGKAVILDETWLYKADRFSALGSIAAAYNIFKRDVFGFWAPLDQQYLATMVRLCRLADVEYVSPFWTLYFFAYLDYSPAIDRAPYPTVRSMAERAAAQGVENGSSTDTGQFYGSLASP